MEPPPRPGMRRKSSASNLLSSFQGSRNATSQTTGGPGSTLPDNASSFTETTATTASAASSLTVPPSSHESVRETINRRLLAIAHIRQSYEGRSHWLNTVMVDRSDLERTLNNHTMKKRTWKFAVLAMSLSPLFSESRSAELVKSLTVILNEWDQMPDQIPDEMSRMKVRGLLRNRPGRRQGMSGFSDADVEPALALNINIPFSLDYFQVVTTFCDILTELYQKLRNAVSSAPQMHSGLGHSVVPGSGYSIPISTPSHSNNSIYSQLFPSTSTLTQPLPESPSPLTTSNVPFIAGGMNPISAPGASGPQGVVDAIVKLDGRLKKIVNLLLREVQHIAQEGIKAELASMDSLLRNIGRPALDDFLFDG